MFTLQSLPGEKNHINVLEPLQRENWRHYIHRHSKFELRCDIAAVPHYISKSRAPNLALQPAIHFTISHGHWSKQNTRWRILTSLIWSKWRTTRWASKPVTCMMKSVGLKKLSPNQLLQEDEQVTMHGIDQNVDASELQQSNEGNMFS